MKVPSRKAMASAVTLSQVAQESANDEYTDYLVYKRLSESSRVKDPEVERDPSEFLLKLNMAITNSGKGIFHPTRK